MLRLLSAMLLVTAIGCGSESDGRPGGPIDIEEGDAGGLSDAAGDSDSSADDAGSSDDGGTTTPGCAFEGFEASTVEAEQSDRLIVTAETAGTPNSILFFRYDSADPVPGVLEFDASDFVDCTACLFVQTGCEDGSCEQTYQARTGAIELLQTSGTFRARLEGLELDRVTVADDGTTTTIDGDGYCIEGPVELTAPLTVDPCADMPEPVFVDVNCGPAPLTVEFDMTASVGQFDPLYSLDVDFGDGESFSSLGSQTKVSHTYAAGDWEARVVISGVIADTEVTLDTPEKIRAY